MFIKDQYATIFQSALKGTEKVSVKNLSISEKKKDGSYDSESWTARFVGKAKDLVDTLPEKTRVKISGHVYAGYDKTTKRNYPYILVTNCEVLARNAGDNPVSEENSSSIDEYKLPF